MELKEQSLDVYEDDFLFYSLLYSSITVVFAVAVLSKFLKNEFRFGFRSFLSLIVLFIGEPLCHLMLRGPLGLTIFGVGCFLIYSILPANHLPVGNKAVLVTGCDSGFGHALVKKLDSIGMRVYAGCLQKNGPGAINLQNTCSQRVKIIQLDVTSNKDLDDAFSLIKSDVGDEGLWGLVNNAGVWTAAELELTAEKVFRRIMEVNLMGVIRVTKKFLPLIRQAKGRIANMSSVAGRIPFEIFGAYAVSKQGIEAYSDTLRLEMWKWGVKVSVIQATGYNTNGMNTPDKQLQKDQVWEAIEEDVKQAYGWDYYCSLWNNYEAAIGRCPTDLTPVIRAMRSALLSKRPVARYPVGSGARTILTLYPFLPFWLGDWISQTFGCGVSDTLPATLPPQQ